MSKSLRLIRQKVPKRGNGKDLQSGFTVTADWLRSMQPAFAVAEGAGDASKVLEEFLPPISL